MSSMKMERQDLSIGDNNKRIGKNVIFLYIRLFFMMILGFVTTRKLLQTLGVENYGLVNVVGGVVSMFSFVSGIMTAAASRFLNYEMGRGNRLGVKQIFNLIVVAYVGLILVLFLLAETVGLWIILSKMTIPIDKLPSVKLFYQFAVIAFLLNIMAIPYRSLLLAFENMRFFALICIGEAIVLLCLVLTLPYWNGVDEMVGYGIIMTVVASAVLLAYGGLCWILYDESRWLFYWDNSRFLELVSFSSWNLFGALSGLFANVLVNLLLNNFFGATINAARGIAIQVSTAISSFAQNFMAAVNPQIIKYHAAENPSEMCRLALRASRFGFFLLFALGTPVIIETKFFLELWLGDVPAHATSFARLAILKAMIDVLSLPVQTMVQATGKVALYQVVVGVVLWMNLPLSYWALMQGNPPEMTMLISVVIILICLFLRLILARRIIEFDILFFLREITLRCWFGGAVAAVLPVLVHISMELGWPRLISVCASGMLSFCLVVYILGITRIERAVLCDSLKLLANRRFKVD